MNKNIIRRRHFLFFSGLGTAVMLVLSLVILYFIVNATVREIIYDNVLETAQQRKYIYANKVDTWFASAYAKVQMLADTLTVLSTPQEYRGPGRREFDETDRLFIDIAERLVQENDYILNVFVGFTDGSIINGIGMTPGGPPGGPIWRPDTHAPWFNAAVEAGPGVVVITEPYWSEGNRAFTAGIAVWLPYLNDIGAVVGFSVRQDDIFYEIAHDPVLGDGYRILVARLGHIIFHSNPDFFLDDDINHFLDLPGGRFLVDYMIRSGQTIGRFYDYLIGPSYFVAARLNTVGWILFDVVPAGAVLGPVSRTIYSIMAPLSVLIVFIYVGALVLFSRIAKQREDILMREQQLAYANSEAKSRFLAKMSHEIRTPITAVLGISEIRLRSPALSPDDRDSFLNIYNSAVLLRDLVNDILDFSMIESDHLSLKNEPYDVADIISAVVQLHKPTLDKTSVKLHLHIDETIPAMLSGDALRIKQIVNNLLSNALKYTEIGSVDFILRCEKREEDNTVALVVLIRDTGLGMTEAQVKTLFIEYTRFHENTPYYISGVGLGMPIVQSLVQLMDAKIEIESEVNKGTTVVVTIPQQVVDPRPIGKETAELLRRVESPLDFFTKRFLFKPEHMPYGRVLVVDDIEANHFVAKGLLSFYDLQVEHCNSGFEAVARIQEGRVYDLVFMDYMMPEMNGTEAMHAMRAAGYKEPIVILTANILAGQAEAFLKEGFDDFLSKPIHTTLLNDLLIKYISAKQPPDVLEAARTAQKARESQTRTDTARSNPQDFGRNPDLVKKLRADFLRNHHNAYRDLCGALAREDIETAHRLAHTIKGAAGLLQDKDLARIAAEAEHSFKNRQSLTTEQLVAFEQELNRLLADIGKNQALHSSAPSAAEPLAPEDARALLDKLEHLLADRNVECLGEISALQRIPNSEALCTLIENFDFSNAYKALTALKNSL